MLCDNAVDFSEASVRTPVRNNRVWNFLEGYEHRKWIANGFRDGFRIRLSKSITKIHQYKTVKLENKRELVKKLNVELENGRILGPYASVPTENMVISPLYVIPKSTPGKFRLIHNLSYPRGASVNDHINDDDKSVHYYSLTDVARFLVGRSENTWWLSKVDLKDAYRCVPIHKADWPCLGMKLDDKYFCDTCLPMGLGTSCRIFTEVSDALAWIFKKRNKDAFIFNYLDDFLILADSESKCQSSLNDFLSSLEYLGFPVSHEKTVQPCQRLEFLGLGIDASALSFYVPDSKRTKTVDMITSFLSTKRHKVHTIQKLVGNLAFLCQSLLPGKSLLGSLYEQLRGILSQDGWRIRRISSGVRDDMMLWRRFLEQATAEKKFHFLFPEDQPSYTITTDASGSVGYGAVMDEEWFSGLWNEEWWISQNIALLELYPIFVALHIWLDKISNSSIHVVTDNMALVSMLNSMYSKDKKINKLLKNCALLAMDHNIVIRALHIRTEDNIIPDRLSRNLCCARYLKSYKQCDIPAHLTTDSIKNLICC